MNKEQIKEMIAEAHGRLQGVTVTLTETQKDVTEVSENIAIDYAVITFLENARLQDEPNLQALHIVNEARHGILIYDPAGIVQVDYIIVDSTTSEAINGIVIYNR